MGWIGLKHTLKTKSRRELAEKRLSKLWARGCEFLGVKYAILGGAMTWVSDHNLVAAISNAGGFGILATGSMNKEQLQSEINLTFKMTSNPFGVNFVMSAYLLVLVMLFWPVVSQSFLKLIN